MMVEPRWLKRRVPVPGKKGQTKIVKVLQMRQVGRRIHESERFKEEYWTEWEDVPTVEEEETDGAT